MELETRATTLSFNETLHSTAVAGINGNDLVEGLRKMADNMEADMKRLDEMSGGKAERGLSMATLPIGGGFGARRVVDIDVEEERVVWEDVPVAIFAFRMAPEMVAMLIDFESLSRKINEVADEHRAKIGTDKFEEHIVNHNAGLPQIRDLPEDVVAEIQKILGMMDEDGPDYEEDSE